MAAIYYHNITKGWFNENDLEDAIFESSPNDIVKFSERGNALLFDINTEDSDIESTGEYSYVRKEWKDRFLKLMGEEWNKD